MLVELDWKPCASPAVIMPITWPAELTSAPPESPGAIGASLWMRLVRCSLRPPPVLAVISCASAVTWPWVALGVPPLPPALPKAATRSPTWTPVLSASSTVGSPVMPSTWISATSAFGDTPMTCALYVPEWPAIETVMLVDPLTTWLLVRIWPSEVTMRPVPAAAPEPLAVWTRVSMITTAGSTLAASASRLSRPLEGFELGCTGVIGACDGSGLGLVVPGVAEGCAMTCASREPAMERASVKPMAVPATPAMIAQVRMTATIHFQGCAPPEAGGAGVYGGGVVGGGVHQACGAGGSAGTMGSGAVDSFSGSDIGVDSSTGLSNPAALWPPRCARMVGRRSKDA